MFYINVGHDHQLQADMGSGKGIILLPVHHHAERIVRDHSFDCASFLLDPQMYLASLDRSDCSKACGRLSSYPWFAVPDVPELEEGMTLATWHTQLEKNAKENWPGQSPPVERAVALCTQALSFQASLGCSYLILPSPLLTDIADDGILLAHWIDAGLRASQECGLEVPVLATIPVDESILTDTFFAPYGFLDAIVDQVTARDGIHGTYILVNQSNALHPFRMPQSVARAYIELVRRLASAGQEQILVNFADVLGAVCLGVGASGFASGESQSRRRLSLKGLIDVAMARRFPRYYSHATISEFYPETDLDKIVERGLLRQVSDPSPYSRRLLEALAAGRSASEIGSWAENVSNDHTSRRHFLFRLIQAEDELSREATSSSRLTSIRNWLEDATMRRLYIDTRLEGETLKGDAAPTEDWVRLLD